MSAVFDPKSQSSKEDNDPLLEFHYTNPEEIANKKQFLAGIPFYDATMNELISLTMYRLEEIRNDKSKHKLQHILALNPYNFFRCRFRKKYRELVENSFINLPGEKGMLAISGILKKPLPGIIPVSLYLMNLIRVAQEKNYTIYIIGSGTETLEKLQSNLLRSFPRLRITGKHHGQLKGKARENVIESVRKTDPHIVILSLGYIPEMEWIRQNSDLLKRSILVGLGGGLNVMAGQKKPAPDFIVESNLTWLWRIFTRPYLWYRFFVLAYGYLFLVYLRLFRKKKKSK